jgi:hypothetical protein
MDEADHDIDCLRERCAKSGTMGTLAGESRKVRFVSIHTGCATARPAQHTVTDNKQSQKSACTRDRCLRDDWTVAGARASGSRGAQHATCRGDSQDAISPHWTRS